jgi:hypothetical protein
MMRGLLAADIASLTVNGVVAICGTLLTGTFGSPNKLSG